MNLTAGIDLVLGWPPAAVYAALFLGAFVEYVFPPFPGDTVVVLGAVLVGAHDWSLVPVWAVICAGTVAGAAVDLRVGRSLAAGRGRLSPRSEAVVDRLVSAFRRWGPALLAVNRFLPGIRALFFVAAGVAGLRTGPVLGWALLSAALWNGVLVGLGVVVGHRLDAIVSVLARYQAGAWVVVGLLVVAVAIAALRGADRRPASGGADR
jgi:membrane protein DedA with SNARE-associated domain